MDEYQEKPRWQHECVAATDPLHEELRRRDEVIRSLEEELAETNRGVVALYAELDTYSEQLRNASELKSRFLTYMSHEFRTPLGSMQSIARILLDRLDGDLTEEQEKQVRFLEKAACELTDMVNDLLDLSKVEAGRVTIAPAWFDMVDLFSAIRGLFKPILQNSSVQLIFDDPTDDPRLFTDDSKLSIILRNLISNALKFTLQGEVVFRRVEAKRGSSRSLFAIRELASPLSICLRFSTTGFRSNQQHKSVCADLGLVCHSADATQNCLAGPCRWKVSWGWGLYSICTFHRFYKPMRRSLLILLYRTGGHWNELGIERNHIDRRRS